MRKLVLAIIFIVFNSLIILAQNKIAQIHPVIGDTVSQSEKRLFLLFSDIPDSTYQFGHITFDNHESYFLISTKNNGDVLKQKIEREDIERYKQNVDKLLLYYAQMDTSFTNDNNSMLAEAIVSKSNRSINSDALKLSFEQRKILVKNARRYSDLKMEGMDSGLWGKDLENYIKTSGSWNIPVLGVLLKSSVTKSDPFIDKVIYRNK